MPINDISTLYTPSLFGRNSFPLKHNSQPIFYKEFSAEDPDVVDLEKDIINIPDHFFKTGEPLTYSVGSRDIKIGISTLSPGALGITTELPNIVYPIVIDKDNIRVSLASTYANNNEYVDLISLGSGTHAFEASKKNSKCLITLNNIIQSPISIASTVKILQYTQLSLKFDTLQNIKIGKCIKVNDEIVRVSSINYDQNTVNISRGSNVFGTPFTPFTNSIIETYASVLAGNYNIIKDIIYFDEPPIEGKKVEFKIASSDINYFDNSFNLITDLLKSGSQVFLSWENPPQEIPKQKFYYIIKNSENNFSFAQTLSDSLNGIKVFFSDVPENEFQISDFNLIYFYPSEENTFNGRVFLRSNYDGNAVFDDISEQFTGITSSFDLKVSGIATVGIKSDNGILLINNIFQYPESEEAFYFEETGSNTAVNFVGFGTTGFTGKDYDVNVKGYPRGGIIVSYGTTSGSNYEPLKTYSDLPLSGSISGIGASASFEIDIYGNVNNFKLTNRGYNYKTGEILVPLYTIGNETQTEDEKLHISINEVAKDTFNAWNVGILFKLDDLSSKANGTRKTFSLSKNGQRLSFDAESQYEIELPYNLLVFINDILQIPNVSYTFGGGSIINFTEPIPAGSNVKIYFYKGYFDDTFLYTVVSNLKEGDKIQVVQDIYDPPPISEKSRVIKEFPSSDVLRTNVYSDVGISDNSSQLRSITWTPQKADLILDGEFISKSRKEQNSGITTFAKIGDYVGTFSGINTDSIGINTTSLLIGDYIEGNYIGTGVSIVSIGSGVVGIASTSYTYSPPGITTSLLSLYRKG